MVFDFLHKFDFKTMWTRFWTFLTTTPSRGQFYSIRLQNSKNKIFHNKYIKKKVTKNMKLKAEKNFTGITCEESFEDKVHLKPLIKTESKVHLKPHIKTESKVNLKPHIKTESLNEKYLKCELCPKICSSKGNLNKHVKQVHMKVKNHYCSLCNMAFYAKWNLKLHVEGIHSNTKSKANLNKHIFSDVSKTGSVSSNSLVAPSLGDRTNDIKNVSKLNESLKMSLPTDEILDQKSEKMGQFPCSICSRIYGTHNR